MRSSGITIRIALIAGLILAVAWWPQVSGPGAQTSGAERSAKNRNLDPGFGPDLIRLGAALPMTGPLSKIGTDVKAALAACFDELNARGGINGRKIEFVVEDSLGEPSDRKSTRLNSSHSDRSRMPSSA